jgi:hypothetical protein
MDNLPMSKKLKTYQCTHKLYKRKGVTPFYMAGIQCPICDRPLIFPFLNIEEIHDIYCPCGEIVTVISVIREKE